MAQTPRSTIQFHQCLGTGGFGEVYLGTLGTGEQASQVAVKVLKQNLDARGQAVQRLRDEARLLHLLEHPNILEVVDLITFDGRIALVTEYVQGEDLEDLLVAPNTLPMAAGLQVMSQVATALHAAYTTMGPRGEPLRLLHRDIKPGNIRIGQDQVVKVLDFGIAKASGVTREAKTQATSVVGSFAYMPPERFKPRQTGTPRGDVYSIGCVLYEILTAGRMLYAGYELRELFGLAMMPDERMRVVDERLGALDAPPDVVALLREMVVEDAQQRPDLPSLARRLEDLAFDCPGQTLALWSDTRRWPPAPSDTGPLSGRTLPYRSLGVQSRPRVTRRGAPTPPPVSSLKPDSIVRAPPIPTLSDAKTVQRPPPADSLGSLMAASITPPPPPVRSAGPSPWLVATALGGVALGVVLVATAVGVVGATSMMGPTSTATDVPVPPTLPVGEPSLPEPKTHPVPRTEPLPSPDRPRPVPVAPTAPASEPIVPAKPVTPEPVPTPIPTPEVPAVCADLLSLQDRAETGNLSSEERECLGAVMRDAKQPLMERNLHGRVLVDDARWRCENNNDCADFERETASFFASVSRSDPDHLLAFARHMSVSSRNQGKRLRAAAKWAGRAIERRGSWPESTRAANTEAAYEIQARSSYQLWVLSSSEATSAAAVKATASWAAHTRASGGDATEAVDLCRSAGGADATCAGF